ncbi:MAG TPA: hypothetical protein VFE54_02080 [Mucilaginibacter sp.]|jgi:hypothetical protein|nr:hypothetical protein [Mucilaginibacter sp.]
MKKYLLKLCVLCFLSVITAGKLFGQAAPADSSVVQNATAQTIANFYISIGQQSRLYSGHEYLPYERTIKGNALYPLDAETWASGEVNYDGVLYKGVPMMYDIYKDVLVVLLYNHFSMYTLLNERVHDFTFSGHHFVRVVADSLVNDKSGISTGFYNQLYGGKVEVLAKRIKTIQNSTNIAISLETYFIAKTVYYVRKGNTYYEVSGQSSFLNVLKDKKPLLQKYIKDNNIKFRQDPESAMASLAAYYDQNN